MSFSRKDVYEAVRALQGEFFGRFEAHPTGSAYFYNSGKDMDILLYSEYFSESVGVLEAAGFRSCASYDDESYGDEEDSTRYVARRGDVNIILCKSREHFSDWLAATDVVSALRSSGVACDKALRTVIFELITDRYKHEDGDLVIPEDETGFEFCLTEAAYVR